MKNVKSMFGAMALGLVLFSSALAGDVSTPGYVAPPPPPSAAPSVNGGTTLLSEASSTGFTLQILLEALSALF
jgi:hypothetical protein